MRSSRGTVNAILAAALGAVLLAIGAGPASGRLVTRPVGAPPLSDRQAARLVHRSAFEPRPQNRPANHRRPSRALLARFRAQSVMPYEAQVDGQFTGTTDEIIQWAAIKHGLAPNLLRAVAVVESYWRMSFVGDSGLSVGLFQVKRGTHCMTVDVCYAFGHDTAFNADYYASIIRAYLDGRQTWLNTVSGNGRPYRAGDLWGSVGAWYSGRWHDPGAEQYIASVKQVLAHHTWRAPYF